MRFASKIIGLACLILAAVMWAVTLSGDLTPGSIGTAASLTAIVAAMFALQRWS
jgi:hypothetical protein